MPIVITGAAVITCLGGTLQETWRAILAGKCGIAELTELESAAPAGKGGGQAVELPGDAEPEMPREARYLQKTIVDALRDAGLTGNAMGYQPQRCGIVLGTTLHGMREGGKFLRTGNYKHLRDFSANAVIARAAEGIAAEAIAMTTCSACSSSLGAIALGMSLLEAGELDLVIAGGYDPISEYAYGGFNALRLVAQEALRPFARDREGMKVSEGYGIVILERQQGAQHRGKIGIARILGYGESADAHHLTQPHPQGDGAARAITEALNSAGLNAGEIDLIAAHATGTPDNDAGEYAAFARTFGDQLARVPVVGFKSHLGHTLGGAGVIELVLSAMALRDQVLPACSENVQAGQTDFANLNLSTGAARPARIRATLNTSLGFGGANTCVILAPVNANDIAAPTVMIRAAGRREVWVTGIGVVVPNAVGTQAFCERLMDSTGPPAWEKDAGPVGESEYLHLLNTRRVRRMSQYVKVSLAATALALTDAGITDQTAFTEKCAAILGTAHGSSDYCHQYYGQVVKQGLIGANPVLFAEGVPNAAAAHLSLMLSLKGACQTIIGTRTAGLDAIRLAALRIASGQWDRAIVGAGEEYYPIVNSAYENCGLYARQAGGGAFSQEKGFVTGAGAVTLILESADSMDRRGGVTPRGKIANAASARAVKSEMTRSVRDVMISIGRPNAVVSSANGTWLDAAEREGILGAVEGNAILSAIYGHVAECFSAMPLLAMAAVLLRGRMPRLIGSGIREGANGSEICDDFAVLSTDYTGLVSGVRVNACVKRGES